jgi:drug/metabolite transporter (DMT)-like permease
LYPWPPPGISLSMHAASGRWKLGFVLALTTAVCWGLLPIALKIVLVGMDAWTITWFRFATSGVVLALFLAWRRRLPLPVPLTRRGWWLYLIAVAGLLANYVLYLVSLDLTSPTVAQVLIQLAPMFLLFGGLVVFRERFAPLQWAGFAVLLGGLALFFHDRLSEVFAIGTQLGLGVALMVAAALTWAIYGLAQKQLLTQLASEQVLLLLYVAATPLLLPATSVAQVFALDRTQLWMLAFCCANTVVAYGCFAEALEHWEVSRVSAVVTLAPLFTLLAMQGASLAWPKAVPAEHLPVASIVGALLVVTGAMTTALGARVNRRTEDATAPPAS